MVEMQFELEDLEGATILVEDKEGEIVEGRIAEIRKKVVKLDTAEGSKWVKEEDLNIIDILFR